MKDNTQTPPAAPLPQTNVPKAHALNPEEKQILMGLRGQLLNGKERVHDLNVALEAAQRELASQAGFNAAVASVAASRGIPNPVVAADFNSIAGS